MPKSNEPTTPKMEVPKKADGNGNPDKHSQHQQAPKVAPDKARPGDHGQHADRAGKK